LRSNLPLSHWERGWGRGCSIRGPSPFFDLSRVRRLRAADDRK
jgi:hypothetical protein